MNAEDARKKTVAIVEAHEQRQRATVAQNARQYQTTELPKLIACIDKCILSAIESGKFRVSPFDNAGLNTNYRFYAEPQDLMLLNGLTELLGYVLDPLVNHYVNLGYKVSVVGKSQSPRTAYKTMTISWGAP